jgi:hypothetical protein
MMDMANFERTVPTSARPPPDRAGLSEEAEALVAHPGFGSAMRAFCRNLTDFHAAVISPRGGIVDTVTWAVAVLVIVIDAADPKGSNASRLIAACRAGGVSGANAARNAIDHLRQGGMIVGESATVPGLPQRLRPSAKLIGTMQGNLAARLSAIELVVPWPAPAAEFARTPGVLEAFLGGNVAAYRENFKLFDDFPEVRAFMDRRCGYLVLLHALGRVGEATERHAALVSLSDIAQRYAVSRAHVRKLFGHAAVQGWLAYAPGGRISFSPACHARLRLWIGYEFVWTRRLLAAL